MAKKDDTGLTKLSKSIEKLISGMEAKNSRGTSIEKELRKLNKTNQGILAGVHKKKSEAARRHDKALLKAQYDDTETQRGVHIAINDMAKKLNAGNQRIFRTLKTLAGINAVSATAGRLNTSGQQKRDARDSKMFHGMLHMSEQNYVVGNQIATEIVKLHSFLRKDGPRELKARLDIMKSDRHESLKREQRLNNMFEDVIKSVDANIHTQGKLQKKVDLGDEKALLAKAMMKLGDNLDAFDRYNEILDGTNPEDRKKENRAEVLAEIVILDKKFGKEFELIKRNSGVPLVGKGVGLKRDKDGNPVLDKDGKSRNLDPKEFLMDMLKHWGMRDGDKMEGKRSSGVGETASATKSANADIIETLAGYKAGKAASQAARDFGPMTEEETDKIRQSVQSAFTLDKEFLSGMSGSGSGGMDCCDELVSLLKQSTEVLQRSVILGSSGDILNMGILGGIDELVDIKRNTRDVAYETNRLYRLMMHVLPRGKSSKTGTMSFGNVRVDESSSSNTASGLKHVKKSFTVDEAEFAKLKADSKYAMEKGYTPKQAQAIHDGIITMTARGELRGPVELKALKAQTTKGSIYTHDTHIESWAEKTYDLMEKIFGVNLSSDKRDRKRYRREIEASRDGKLALGMMSRRGGRGGLGGPGGPGEEGFFDSLTVQDGILATLLGGEALSAYKNKKNKTSKGGKGKKGMIVKGILGLLAYMGFDALADSEGEGSVARNVMDVTDFALTATSLVAAGKWANNKWGKGSTGAARGAGSAKGLPNPRKITIDQKGNILKDGKSFSKMKDVTPKNSSWIKNAFKDYFKTLSPTEIKTWFKALKAGSLLTKLRVLMIAGGPLAWAGIIATIIAEEILVGYITDALQEIVTEREAAAKNQAKKVTRKALNTAVTNVGAGQSFAPMSSNRFSEMHNSTLVAGMPVGDKLTKTQYEMAKLSQRMGNTLSPSMSAKSLQFEIDEDKMKRLETPDVGLASDALTALKHADDGPNNSLGVNIHNWDDSPFGGTRSSILEAVEKTGLWGWVKDGIKTDVNAGFDGLGANPTKAQVEALWKGKSENLSKFGGETESSIKSIYATEFKKFFGTVLGGIGSVLFGSNAMAGDIPYDPSGRGHGYGNDPDGKGFWDKGTGKKKPKSKAERDKAAKAKDKFRDDYNKDHPNDKLDWPDAYKPEPGQGDLFPEEENFMGIPISKSQAAGYTSAAALIYGIPKMMNQRKTDFAKAGAFQKMNMAQNFKVTTMTNAGGPANPFKPIPQANPSYSSANPKGYLSMNQMGDLKGAKMSNKMFEQRTGMKGSTLGWLTEHTSSKHFQPVETMIKGLKFIASVPFQALMLLLHSSDVGAGSDLVNYIPNQNLTNIMPGSPFGGGKGQGGNTIINNSIDNSTSSNSAVVQASIAHAPALPEGLQGY